jgi:hypothetical protein
MATTEEITTTAIIKMREAYLFTVYIMFSFMWSGTTNFQSVLSVEAP